MTEPDGIRSNLVRTAARCGLLSLLAAAACSDSSDPVARTDTRSSSTAAHAIERRTADVDWKAASAFRNMAPAAVPHQLLKVLASSPVPALVPSQPSMLATATPTRGATWYAVSIPLDEHTVFLTGNRSEVFVPGISDRATARRSFEPRISRSRGVVSASFLAFGVAYTIEVECARPFEDVRCTEDAYVLELLAGLAVAGGEP